MLIQLTNSASKPKPKNVFYSYSHKDEEFKDKLDEHLAILKRDGFIDVWHDRMIRAGQEWDGVINEHINNAEIILLLISPSFMASQYCQDIEVKRAIERNDDGSAKVIPIILKPIVWSDSPFSKLQALPSRGRPITSWKEIDEAFKDVVEQIRITLIEIEFPRTLSNNIEGLTGQWFLKLESNSAGQNGFSPEAIVAKLKEISKDYSIKLLGTAMERIVDGEKFKTGHMLILTGSPEGFDYINNLFTNNELSTVLGVNIKTFEISKGSTIQTSSILYQGNESQIPEEESNLIFESEEYSPVNILGLKVNKKDLTRYECIMIGGNENTESSFFRDEYNKVVGYFSAALAVEEENQWVNLSAYESNRMLPKALEGTLLGRDMLAMDCLLKRFTASILHPDNYLGRQYWNEVYKKADELYGTTEIPLDTFQKVWIIPQKAVVYETNQKNQKDEPVNELSSFLESLNLTEDNELGFITESELDVLTETDLFALSHNYNDSISKKKVESYNDFTIMLFKEIILPAIKKEINQGKNFAALRQIYNAFILGYWFKKNFNYGDILPKIINSNNPDAVKLTIQSMRQINFDQHETIEVNEFNNAIYTSQNKIIDHINPDDPAFDIKENKEFYQEYIKMYRNGVFKCARAHTINGRKMIRMYFSGAIDFRYIGITRH